MDGFTLNLVFMGLGVALLYYGAESLIKGSASFALRMGLPPLVVGLTVVGYGTGMPELIVSVDASLMQRGEIAIGNVIGSNICNIGLIMGLSAMIRPLAVKRQLVRYDVPIMIAISILFPIMLINGYLSSWKGALFLLSLFIYTGWAIHFCKTHDHGENVEVEDEVPNLNKNAWVDWMFIIAGFAGMWLGARLFVTGTVAVAKVFGVSDAVIGLSVVAFGTSLPELATSMIAIMRNQRDLAVGNLIGSNIFNILAIVGVTGLIHPFVIQGINWIDYGVMILFAVAVLPIMITDFAVKRWEGALLFVG
ncbi:MAG: calcium/sodium antiporter, partial [Chlamydiota bacterium]